MPWLVYLGFENDSQSKTLLVDCPNQKAVDFVMGHAFNSETTKEWKLTEYSVLYTGQKIKQKTIAGHHPAAQVKFVTVQSLRGFAKEFGLKDLPISF